MTKLISTDTSANLDPEEATATSMYTTTRHRETMTRQRDKHHNNTQGQTPQLDTGTNTTNLDLEEATATSMYTTTRHRETMTRQRDRHHD